MSETESRESLSPSLPFLRFDGMVWPNPAALGDLQHRLTYDEPTRGDLMVACSVIRAYAQLVSDPQRRRNEKVAGIRREMEANRG